MSGLRGLYAVTDPRLTPAPSLAERVGDAIDGGARLVQYRNKSGSAGDRLADARALAALCRQRGVPFLVNDDLELAVACGADGVHLGQHDAPLEQARAMLGPDRLIGVSCHASVAAALDAQRGGADYVAFGRFFDSRTKPAAPHAGLQTLRDARRRLDIPIVAIGGVTPDNGAALIEAGADMLAAIHAVFGTGDPRQAASGLAALFHCTRTVQT